MLVFMYAPVTVAFFAVTSAAIACLLGDIANLAKESLFDRLVLCGIDEFFVDSGTCISQLPSVMNGKVSGLEESCKACLHGFVDMLANSRDSVDSTCASQPAKSACLQSVAIQEALFHFQECSGISLLYPNCRSEEVRQFAQSGITASIFSHILEQDSSFTSDTIPPSVCGTCYLQFGESLLEEAGNDPIVKAAVEQCAISSIESTSCRTGIQHFLDTFESCSGFDIDRRGPECAVSEQAEIAEINPIRMLTLCAFKPEDASCLNVSTLFAQIETLSSTSCSTCYHEFFDKVSIERATFDAGSVCSNVDSSECSAWNDEQLKNLYSCTSGEE